MKNFPRLWGWMVVAILLLGAVAIISPQQFPVVMYKLAMVTLSAVVAYWVDRSLFKESAEPRLRTAMPRDMYSSARLLARALVFVGTVLGITLGL